MFYKIWVFNVKYRLIGVSACAIAVLICIICYSLPLDNSRRSEHRATAATVTSSDSGGDFSSHLPLIVIDTGGAEIPGEPTGDTDSLGEDIYTLSDDGGETVSAAVSIIDSGTGANLLTDAPAVTSAAQISLHGHESRFFEKSSYKITFFDGDEGISFPVMGMKASDE